MGTAPSKPKSIPKPKILSFSIPQIEGRPSFSPNKSVQNDLVANNELIKIDEEKAAKALKEAQEKAEQAIIAIQNEESAKILAEKLKQEANEAHQLAAQIVSTSTASQEVQQKLVDNAVELAEKSRIADYEVGKANEERIRAEKSAEVAKQQATIAKEITKINTGLDISNMKPSIKISNKVTKGKFKLVDGFQLKCPDGFVQQGTHCGRLIEISNSSFGEGDVEGFENTRESNSFIILIILVLIIVLAYRNKDFVKRTLNISL